MKQNNNIETNIIAPEEEILGGDKPEELAALTLLVANKIHNLKLWIEKRTEKYFTIGEFLEKLPKGEILLDLVKSIDPSVGPVYRSPTKNYRHTDNISKFCQWLKKIRFPNELIFDSIDIYESKNFSKVIRCLLNISNFLSQRKLAPKLFDYPCEELPIAFIKNVQDIVKTSYKSNINAIINHNAFDWIDTDDFYSKDGLIKLEFKNWNVECYDISIAEEFSEEIALLLKSTDPDRFQNLYYSKNGRSILEYLLFSQINSNLNLIINSKKMLDRYSSEIIKFPSLYIGLQYGKTVLPASSILNWKSSDSDIFMFIKGLLDLDLSNNYSMTLLPLLFFFKESSFYWKLQDGISSIIRDCQFSIDPVDIYKEKYRCMPFKENYNRENIVFEVLKDNAVECELIKRQKKMMMTIDRILNFIDYFEYPEYFICFLKKFDKLNKRNGMSIYFDELIAPLFTNSRNNVYFREITKVIFKNIQIFSEVIPTGTSITYYKPLELITDVDYFILSPFNNFIKEKQIKK